MDTATLGKILGKAMSAWRAAEAAKKARELVRRKSVLTKSTLPGKLADCTTSDKAASEIFVVEGDSAGVRCRPAAGCQRCGNSVQSLARAAPALLTTSTIATPITPLRTGRRRVWQHSIPLSAQAVLRRA